MSEHVEWYTEIHSKRSPLRSKQLLAYWRYRDLFYFLARRDVLVRYKQTVFGAGWAILQPLMTVVVFAIFFGRLGRLPSDGVPYELFVVIATVSWAMFSSILNNVTGSLLANANLITKIYFPRLILPLSSVATPIVDFIVCTPVLAIALIYYQASPEYRWLAFPLFLLLGIFVTTGVGLFFAAIIVTYRDMKTLTTYLAQLWMFISPVTYASSLIPDKWKGLYSMNPMVTVLDGLRWSLLGTPMPSISAIATSGLLALLLLATGAIYFHYSSDTFADVI